jgi:hypothetical protein
VLLAFPWLFVPFGLYNLIVFSKAGTVAPQEVFNQAVGGIRLASGAIWSPSLGDVLITLALMLLFGEILQAAAKGAKSLLDHCLSVALFLLCVSEFIVKPEAATSVFFLFVFISLIDVLAGFCVTFSAARRDFAAGGAS